MVKLLIGITSEGDSKDSMVAMHFGDAPYIALVDLEKDEMEFMFLGKEHCLHLLPYNLKEKNVGVFITWSMGPRPAEIFQRKGIKLYHVPRRVSVEEAIELYKSGSLIEFTLTGSKVDQQKYSGERGKEHGMFMEYGTEEI